MPASTTRSIPAIGSWTHSIDGCSLRPFSVRGRPEERGRSRRGRSAFPRAPLVHRRLLRWRRPATRRRGRPRHRAVRDSVNRGCRADVHGRHRGHRVASTASAALVWGIAGRGSRRVTTQRGFAYRAAMSPIAPFLWFHGDADEAVDDYVSIFPNSRPDQRQQVRTAHAPSRGDDADCCIRARRQTVHCAQRRTGLPVHAGGFLLSSAARPKKRSTTTGNASSRTVSLPNAGGSPTAMGSRGRSCRTASANWSVTPILNRANRVLEAMMKMVKIDLAGLEAAATG